MGDKYKREPIRFNGGWYYEDKRGIEIYYPNSIGTHIAIKPRRISWLKLKKSLERHESDKEE